MPQAVEGAEAASAVAELKTRLDRGTYVKPTARTLGEYALEWLPRRERSDFHRHDSGLIQMAAP